MNAPRFSGTHFLTILILMEGELTGSERAKMIDHYVDHYLSLASSQEVDFATIRSELNAAGVPPDAIELIVRFVNEGMMEIAANGGPSSGTSNRPSFQFVIAGGVIMAIGIYTTVYSYVVAPIGGRYVFSYGALLAGLSLLLTGLAQGGKRLRRMPMTRKFKSKL